MDALKKVNYKYTHWQLSKSMNVFRPVHDLFIEYQYYRLIMHALQLIAFFGMPCEKADSNESFRLRT